MHASILRTAMILHLPTEPTLHHLASLAHSFVVIRKNWAFGRWLGQLYSHTGKLLFTISHFSHSHLLKLLLEALEKRLSNYSI